MSINDLATPVIETPKQEVITPDQISPPIDTELEIVAITDILGLTREEVGKYHDKIDTILEWAKSKSTDHSLENLKWVIRDLGFNLGTPPLGQKLVNWLAEYAYLNKESNIINKQLNKMKHG
jgi:hypothetical protein